MVSILLQLYLKNDRMKISSTHLKVSSTPSISSTYRPLIEPIDFNGLSLVVDDVDDVDDKKTLFSKDDSRY
jgi:hypothetical protein